MRVIIAGGRNITDRQKVCEAIFNSNFNITEVVSGGAKGVDRLGELWAIANNKSIARFPANWEKHGRSAGPIRNNEMAKYADALIAIWDGKSTGTKNMIKNAEAKSLKIHIEECN